MASKSGRRSREFRLRGLCFCGRPLWKKTTHCAWCVYKSHVRKLSERIDAILAYGSRCVKCGLDDYESLVFDHIHDDGGQERRNRDVGSGGYLRRIGYPKDRFQLLCHNCNFKKERARRTGKLPSKEEAFACREIKQPKLQRMPLLQRGGFCVNKHPIHEGSYLHAKDGKKVCKQCTQANKRRYRDKKKRVS